MGMDIGHVTLGNQQHKQRSTEEEIYRRIQQAKANRRGGNSNEQQPRSRTNGSGGFCPPIPKQNGNGKNSKHSFWPRPNNSNNNNNNNNNTRSNNGQSNNSRRGKQVLFQKSTSSPGPLTQDVDESDQDDDQVDMEDESENYSSDDLINRGADYGE